MRILLHVDMDAFFASVELLHHPEWRGKPLVVGSPGDERGVVSTCSYEARRFGIHSAMPSRTAYQLCPHAIFTHPHGEWYREVSEKVFAIFEHYTPYVEGVSIDEAFLDVTGSLHRFAKASDADETVTAVRLGEALRAEIRRDCGVTCSVGIAPNRLLAKIGSEQHKPDGLTLMPFDAAEISEFLRPKPLSILWGIGKSTEAALRPFGIVTCGDLQRTSLSALRSVIGSDVAARSLLEYAFGRSDDTVHWQPQDEKSVSREHTFDVDECNRDAVRAKLLELVADVGRRFRRERRWARTAKLKLRLADFTTLSRQMSLAVPSRDDAAFRAAASALFENVWNELKTQNPFIRLVGFGVANFVGSPNPDGQLSLFEEPSDAAREKQERLSEALDALRDKGLI